jgi:hypothetical protein
MQPENYHLYLVTNSVDVTIDSVVTVDVVVVVLFTVTVVADTTTIKLILL